MPRLSVETYGSGDQSWLGSTHGIHSCRTETVDPTKFTAATHYPNGHIRSGQPVAKVGGVLVPFNSNGADGSQNLAGFIYTDQKVVGTAKFAVPLLDHGRVKVGRLSALVGNFTPPAPAADKTTVVYV